VFRLFLVCYYLNVLLLVVSCLVACGWLLNVGWRCLCAEAMQQALLWGCRKIVVELTRKANTPKVV